MKLLALSFIIFNLVFCFNSPASGNEGAQPDNKIVNQWNTFVDNIYQLHLKQTADKEIKTSKRSGSYHRLPDFFQEVKFFNSDDNTLLSKIEWETQQPDKIHSIEVYIHDNENRLVREYFASYLPRYRNAPYQTLINLHHYTKSLHSFRQYDASDNLIYEVCKSTDTNEKLFEHDDYEIPDSFMKGTGLDKTYQQCFNRLPRSAKEHLVAH